MSAQRPAALASGCSRLGLQRLLLATMSITALVPGGWAAAAPRSFYDAFPGAAHWVDLLPPYNEHLIVDAGAFYLAFALLLARAALAPAPSLVRAACWAWMLFGALHLVFHATHLDRFSEADAIGELASLGVSVVLPVVVLWLARASPRARVQGSAVGS